MTLARRSYSRKLSAFIIVILTTAYFFLSVSILNWRTRPGHPHENFNSLINYQQQYTVLNEPVYWIPEKPSEDKLSKVNPMNLSKYVNTTTQSWHSNNSKQQLMNDWKVNGFLFYRPISGMSNQLMMFETAVIAALHSRRILVIPPILNAHSKQFPIDSCVLTTDGNLGGIYTFQRACELESIQFYSYFDIIQPNNGSHIFSGPSFLYVYVKDYIQFFQNEVSKVPRSHVMSDTFYAQTEIQWVYDVSYDRGSTLICNKATTSFISSALKKLGIEQFIGVHLRRGDYEDHCKNVLPHHFYFEHNFSLKRCYPTEDYLIGQVNEFKQQANISNVIVIHNENNQTFIQQMISQGWIMEEELWNNINIPYPRDITIPVIDQCLMTLADFFLGNDYSSFSMRIRVMRKMMGKFL